MLTLNEIRADLCWTSTGSWPQTAPGRSQTEPSGYSFAAPWLITENILTSGTPISPLDLRNGKALKSRTADGLSQSNGRTSLMSARHPSSTPKQILQIYLVFILLQEHSWECGILVQRAFSTLNSCSPEFLGAQLEDQCGTTAHQVLRLREQMNLHHPLVIMLNLWRSLTWQRHRKAHKMRLATGWSLELNWVSRRAGLLCARNTPYWIINQTLKAFIHSLSYGALCLKIAFVLFFHVWLSFPL